MSEVESKRSESNAPGIPAPASNLQPPSSPCVGQEHADTYVQGLRALVDNGVPFLLGGAFAVWHYTGIWRHTHDIDVFTPPEHVPRAVESLSQAGFSDLGEQAHGDRGWIYHAGKDQIIVDVIFRSANRVTTVTDEWIDRGRDGERDWQSSSPPLTLIVALESMRIHITCRFSNGLNQIHAT